MGFEETLKQFLQLTRKDLKVLCKQYKLPTNRGHYRLAQLLALYYENGNSSAAVAKEKAIGYANEAKTQQTSCSTGKSNEIHFNGNSDPSGRNCQDGDEPDLHLGCQVGSFVHEVTQTPGKAVNTDVAAVCPIPDHNGTIRVSASSTSQPVVIGKVGSQSSAPIQENAVIVELGSPGNAPTFDKEQKKSLELGPSSPETRNQLVTDNTRSSPCKNTKVGECLVERDSASLDKISANASPSLQFFVMSEEGINLIVDLNSTPSKWVSKFKSEVSIKPSTHHHEPGNYSNFLSSIVNRDGHTKVSPSGSIIVDIESKGAERSIPCTNSSLSSAVHENCQSEACPLDATVVTSESSAFTLLSTQVEISGSHEAIPVVSSSCLTSDVQNNITSDIASCPSDLKGIPQDSVDGSFIGKSSAPISDAFVKPLGKTDTLSPGTTKDSDKTERLIMNIAVADSDSVATSTLGKTDGSYSPGNCFMTSKGKQENLDTSGTVKISSCCGVPEVEMQSEQVEVVAAAVDVDDGDRVSISCEIIEHLKPDFRISDAQSVASSADNIFARNVDLINLSSSSENLDKITPLKQKYSPGSMHRHDSLGKKRLHETDDLEEFQSKRQLLSDENKSGATMTLRSSRSSTRETKLSPISQPRRSSRLVPK